MVSISIEDEYLFSRCQRKRVVRFRVRMMISNLVMFDVSR